MFDGKIPKLRKDIDLQIIGDGEDRSILLYDKRGFAKEPLMITYDFLMFLSILEAGITEKELQEMLFQETGESDISLILESIKILDDDLMLESDNYFQKVQEDAAEYAMLSERPLITNGKSFPDEPNEFAKFMDDLFKSKHSNNLRKDADAIIVPHIDLSLNGISHPIYAAGYDSIAEKDFDTIVILGTSHFAFSDYFMLTKKPYITPNGIIENDDAVINYLEKNYGDTFTFDDQAHRFEHSIEYQAVLSKYFFKNKNFKIIPILVGSFHQFISEGHQPNTDERINKFLAGLKEALSKANRHPIFIASVDFSHIGMKFGDEFDAKDLLQECKDEDFKLIQSIENTNKKAFFDSIIETEDNWKVCGVAPIYSLLTLMDSAMGYFLDYNQWYEEPTKSSVSFASLAFWNK
mgnify:CR=1 FL=1